MPKSKNNRKTKQKNNNHLKSVPSKPSAIINHSPNSKILATLINNNDLNGLSFFIQELSKESDLIFDHGGQEWFNIFIESIKKDLSLAIYVAKCIYYHYSCDISKENSLNASQVLGVHVYTNSSPIYKKECILPISFDNLIEETPLELQVFTDTHTKLLQWALTTQKCYQSIVLHAVINRQNVLKKVTNF